MKSVAIMLNPGKDAAVRMACTLVKWLQEQHVLVMVEHDAAVAMSVPSLSREESDLVNADFALVMGGDGTLLRASRLMSPAGIPMLAIRYGQFGFMTDNEPSETMDALAATLAGRHRVDERMMLQAAVVRSGTHVDSSMALNDVVISKGPLARMLRLSTHVSGRFVSHYNADGLIVATPTGSTAYSLSAGGPLVTPDLKVTIITPICPHTLNIRPLLVSSEHAIEIRVESESGDDVMLTVDGQVGFQLQHCDTVTVKEAECKAKLICVNDITFFDKLQTRLRWGDRFDTC